MLVFDVVLVVLKLSGVRLCEPVALFEMVSEAWLELSAVTVEPEGMPLPEIDEPTAMPVNEATALTVFEPFAVVPVVVAVLVEVVVPVSSYRTSPAARVQEPWLCVPGPPVSFARRLALVSGGNAIRPTRSSAWEELQLDWPAAHGSRFERSVDTPAFAQSSLLASWTDGQTPD